MDYIVRDENDSPIIAFETFEEAKNFVVLMMKAGRVMVIEKGEIPKDTKTMELDIPDVSSDNTSDFLSNIASMDTSNGSNVLLDLMNVLKDPNTSDESNTAKLD